MDNTKDITKYLLRRLSNVILLFAILSEGNDKAYTVNLLDLGGVVITSHITARQRKNMMAYRYTGQYYL